MITLRETGSGLASAHQGRHFNSRTALRQTVAIGTPVSDWQSELLALTARKRDGSVRCSTAVDAECAQLIDTAATAGKKVLLIVTDTSKTGLIVPGISTAWALKQRWPAQVEVMVVSCQFRVSTATIRAYVEHGYMVALTGSKFVDGPTFSGVMLIPRLTAARHRGV
ncbi:MAG: hypothetical protein H7315_14585 [Herminiimonas sp.]|nr:hypothetical protein [Herminiimonas sp.]